MAGNIIIASILNLLMYLYKLFYWLILIRCILSWIPQYNGTIKHLIYSMTDPILDPFDKLLSKTPLGRLPINLSPVFAIAAMSLIYQLLNNFLYRILF